MEDDESESKLERVLKRLREVTGSNHPVETTSHIEGSSVQAAVYPDGSIKITQSLVEKLDEDELAFVMAHEMAHLEGNHVEKQQASVIAKRAVLHTTMRAKDRAQKNAGVGIMKRIATQVAGNVFGAAAIVISSRLESQHYESKADERAIEIAEQAGYDPESSVTALEKISGGYTHEASVVENIISTHPTPRRRERNLLRKSRGWRS